MKTLKTLMLNALLALCLLAPLHRAHADLIKQGAAYSKTVLVTDSSGNNVTGLTTSSFTATASKAGAAATSITTPTVTEIGQGKYSFAIPASLTTTLGALDITLTAAGTTQTDSHDQIVGFDPASDLGAAALAGLGTGQTSLATGQAGLASTQAAIKAKTDTITAYPTDYAKAGVAPTWYIAPTTPDLSGIPGAVWGYGTKTITGGTITTYTGNTPQTGDAYLRLGSPVGADLAHDIAAAKASADAGPAATVTALKADSDWQQIVSQVSKIYGAEWGGLVKQSDGSYNVLAPNSSTVVIGNVHPLYDTAGKPTNTTKSVN